jgi:hypothetical protein
MLSFADDFLSQGENAREQRKMNRFWKWTLSSFLGLMVLVFAGLSFMAGSPRDVYGLVRYALPHMHRGRLNPGDDAPDVRLLALDGSNHFHLRERTGARPLVVVFGSYT